MAPSFPSLQIPSGGGVYVHIPYCKTKCLYCDFYSGGSRIANWEELVGALIKEGNSRKSEIIEPSTLYIGGGTPSLLPSDSLERLVTSISKIFNVNSWEEFTIEVNPEDVNVKSLVAWENIGVNRLSMGVQSLNDRELKTIGRLHNSRDALEAILAIKEMFTNFSIDVMFGIPGQSLKGYETTLEKLVELTPPHISSYSLMLEPGTPMTILQAKGKIELPSEEEWLKMSQLTSSFLKEAGYKRYEISNYALPEFESLHNSNYWLGKPYLGLGPSAHSFDGANTRRWNNADIKGYLNHFSSLHNPENNLSYQGHEILTLDELREEMIMTRLRMAKGLGLNEFETRFGVQQKKRLLKNSESFMSSGHLEIFADHLRFTDKGFQISDTILSSLI